MSRCSFLACWLTLPLLPSGAWAANPTAAAGIEFFEKKVRPVLVQHCYQCHSAQAKKLRGELSLDTRAGLLKGGESGPAVVPGKPALSLLVKALRHDGDLKMPPKGKLPEAVVTDFVKWVEMGAPDPRREAVAAAKRTIDVAAGRKYWAFQPLRPPGPPVVKNVGWARTPIDRFLLARLEEKGIAPNGPLAREKLVRRAYFDLLGLPPTPAEVDAFVKDTAPDAYERLVDRLLHSEHYGERWARHWLDVVRFAESGGYEFDKDRPGAYQYRDFVIRALNQDMPYDRFVRWQVAGDQLRPGDFLAAAATSFLVAGPFPGQTTAKTLDLIRYDQLDDMVSTLGTSLLGLSLGCARCHDHKYDPVPQQDYYRLLACLGRTDSFEAKLDPHPEIYRQAKAAFDQAHAPYLAARDRFEQEELPGRLHHWLQGQQAKPAPTWLVLDLASAAGKPAAARLPDGSVRLPVAAKGKGPDTYTLTARTYLKDITALRLEALADGSLPQKGPGLGPDGNFLLTNVILTVAPLAPVKPVQPLPVKVRAGRTTFEQAKHPLAAALDNKQGAGWAVGGAAGKDHAAVFEADKPFGFDGGTVLTVTLKFAPGRTIGRPRLAFRTGKGPTPLAGEAVSQRVGELLALLREGQDKLTAKNHAGVVHWFRTFDPAADKVYAAEEEHARKAPKPNLIDVFMAQSGRGGPVHFLTRGEVDRKTGVASPGFIQVLMTAPEQDRHWLAATAPKGPAVQSRKALARWLTDIDAGAGRLLARVIVNRLWQHHFGRGLVRTPNDFGVQGEPPTHPELLDWLAAELVRGGWRLKPTHRLIMTSAAYQQDGAANAVGLRLDPHNHLWWRMPPRRLEAEAVRDALLAVGGALDRTRFGPGTLTETSPRRSIYLTVKRSRLLPLLQAFDAPEPIQSIGERQLTTVPTQALALMNSPFVRQQAEKLARLVRPPTAEGLPAAVEEAYRRALARRPSAVERQTMLDFIRRPGPAGLDGALADFCQVLLCLNEFIYVD